MLLFLFTVSNWNVTPESFFFFCFGLGVGGVGLGLRFGFGFGSVGVSFFLPSLCEAFGVDFVSVVFDRSAADKVPSATEEMPSMS